MISDKMFVGSEAEGPDWGQLTLFVPCGSISNPDEPLNVLKKYNYNIRRVYYGGGNKRGISSVEKESALVILKKCPDVKMLLEIEGVENMRGIYQLGLSHLPPKLVEKMIIIYVVDCPNTFHPPYFPILWDELSKEEFSKIDVVKFLGREQLYWIEVKGFYITSFNDNMYKNDILVGEK